MTILEPAGDTLALDGARGKPTRLLVAVELEGDPLDHLEEEAA